MHTPSSILLVGDVDHADFADAVTWLCELGAEAFATCAEAAAALSAEPRWIDVVLFCQSRPGQLAVDEVERLHRKVPLAQLVSLEGCWCEGQFRNGRPLPGIARVYWHQWASRLQRWLDVSNTALPVWQRTSTIAEMLDQYSVIQRATTPALIAVACEDVTTFDGLADVLQDLGYAAVWLPPTGAVRVAGVNGLLWSNRVDTSRDRLELQRTLRQCGYCPTVAVLDFPRSGELDRLAQLGVTQTLARPFSHSDLHHSLCVALDIGSSGLSASA